MPRSSERAAELALDALGSPTRRHIIRVLRDGPRAVGAIAAKLPVSRPAVSKHLQVLEEAGLVTTTRRGTRTLVCLHRPGFASARGWLESFWDEALDAFVRVAEEEGEP